MKITLEPIDAVRPSTYNPRSADPARLDIIELSLRKLGFIAPIFADTDGEILSGHQRHLVADRMGATHVPVFRTKALDLDQRKALNIVFNRATNDFDFHHTPGRVTRDLESLDMTKLAEGIPDKPVGSDGFLRCLKPAEVRGEGSLQGQLRPLAAIRPQPRPTPCIARASSCRSSAARI